MSEKAMTILVIEDDAEISSMLSKALEAKSYQVETAFDGYVGLKMANEKQFDAIILDLNLPLMNGYEVCKQIRKSNGKIPILMLTAYSAMENKLTGFDTGADDYITKPFEIKELLARLHVAIRRRHTSESVPEVLRIADLEMDLYYKKVRRSGKEIVLTAKEFALLEFLIRNKNRIISKAEIAEKIWEVTFDTGTNIIEVYVNFLRKKIDREFSPKLIHTVIGMGYILKEE